MIPEAMIDKDRPAVCRTADILKLDKDKCLIEWVEEKEPVDIQERKVIRAIKNF